MYFDDDHDDAEGHRSLIVEREKTSELFENMKGNAILFTVFGEHKECCLSTQCNSITTLTVFILLFLKNTIK